MADHITILENKLIFQKARYEKILPLAKKSKHAQQQLKECDEKIKELERLKTLTEKEIEQ